LWLSLTVIVRGLLDPCCNPLPFLELLMVTHEPKRNGKQSDKAAILFHARDAGRFHVFAARRWIGLAKNKYARLSGSHRLLAPNVIFE
jgi:hypothetical protein